MDLHKVENLIGGSFMKIIEVLMRIPPIYI
jgi:hypothetical protein